jgi:hypothetical protein
VPLFAIEALQLFPLFEKAASHENQENFLSLVPLRAQEQLEACEDI